jgi:hypothetical protein
MEALLDLDDLVCFAILALGLYQLFVMATAPD